MSDFVELFGIVFYSVAFLVCLATMSNILVFLLEIFIFLPVNTAFVCMTVMVVGATFSFKGVSEFIIGVLVFIICLGFNIAYVFVSSCLYSAFGCHDRSSVLVSMMTPVFFLIGSPLMIFLAL